MTLKQLRLLNFKCFKNQTIDFGRVTNIFGANATGKSSIADAYSWLLFGKDTDDREDFAIKPLDQDGKTNPDAVTEVIGLFGLGDGSEIELKRTLRENWATPKGEDTPVFKGNVCQRYIKGIEVGVDEYDNKLIEMTAPSVIVGAGKKARAISALKLISIAKYFNETLHWTERQEILYGIAPPISDEDIVKAHPELAGIEPALAMGIDVYAAQEKPKLKELQKALDAIPAKIEENERSCPVAEDFAAIEKEIAEKQAAVELYDKTLFDISAAYEGFKRKQQEIYGVDAKIQAIDNQRKNLLQGVRDGKANLIESTKRKLEQTKGYLLSTVSTLEAEKAKLAEMNRELSERRAANAILKSETFVPPDANHFVCPTCLRPLDPEDIDLKIEELRQNWNKGHATRLEADRREGLALKARIEGKEELIASLKLKAASDQGDVDKLEQDLYDTENNEIKPPTFDDTERNALIKQIEDMKTALSEPVTNRDDTVAARTNALAEIDELKRKLYAKTLIETTTKRIDELKAQEKTAAGEKAKIEKMLYKLGLFSRIKVAMLEDNLSDMFKHTRIKLLEIKEPNGKRVEEETCTATLGGVDYRDVNTAGKAIINLDIANALSRAYGFVAPVFFDNREGVNELIPTELQTVNLFVTRDDEKLRVEVM